MVAVSFNPSLKDVVGKLIAILELYVTIRCD